MIHPQILLSLTQSLFTTISLPFMRGNIRKECLLMLNLIVPPVETSRTKLSEGQVTPAPRRRLIKADLRLSSNFDEDDEIMMGKSLEDLTFRPEDNEDESHDSFECVASRSIPRVPSSLSLDHPTQSSSASHESFKRKFSLKSCESSFPLLIFR